MAMDFDGPAAIVEDAYNRSVALADDAVQEMTGFIERLEQNLYSPAAINVQWQTLPAPTLPGIPTQPILPGATFNPGATKPGALDATLEPVQIDDFTVLPPTLTAGEAPEVNFGTVPLLPAVNDVAVPDAPTVVLPDLPQMLSLQTVTFGGVNLHEDWLDKLDEIPELQIIQPTRLQYTRGPGYASTLLDNLKATINARLMGGSGINPNVEQALFDRMRDRETQLALGRTAEVNRTVEALNFPLPPGVLVGMQSDAQREYFDKLSGASRDITIKQADLEQTNLANAIQSAIALESQLIDYSYKIELLTFEAAKALADNEIQVLNAQIEQYKALLAGYDSYARAYDTLIKAELSKVEVFKAQLEAEGQKVAINTALVNQYKAEIEGRMAQVEIFKAQVSAAQTLVELERARIQTAGEQIRAFVALTNAEMSKVEIFKAKISADGLKLDGYRTQAQAYQAKAGAQAERARAMIAQYDAQVRAKGLEWEGFRSLIGAETARVESIARQTGIAFDGYKVAVTANQAQAELYSRVWEANMKQYEASATLTMQAAKINQDALLHTRNANLDAAKVGAQVTGQKVASAFNIVNTSATISGQATLTQVINS